jgi:acetyltransferase-like isoleucine patch superfamily enzyme
MPRARLTQSQIQYLCAQTGRLHAIRALFSELIGKTVDERFLLIPPFYTTGGDEIRVGQNVFINQNCTFYDLGGLDVGDDVMIGPNVSLITSGHHSLD